MQGGIRQRLAIMSSVLREGPPHQRDEHAGGEWRGLAIISCAKSHLRPLLLDQANAEVNRVLRHVQLAVVASLDQPEPVGPARALADDLVLVELRRARRR